MGTVGNMRSMAMVVISVVLMVTMVGAQYGGGSCDWSQCRYDRYLAQRCCSSSGTCCDFANGGNNGYNNGGFNNNNKPGSCPPYNGRKKRSPRGRFPGNGNGRFPGNNGYNNGGQGYNPGYNNGNGYNNNNGGSCIRDSECSADLKCCYLRSGYQCTSPLGNYFG